MTQSHDQEPQVGQPRQPAGHTDPVPPTQSHGEQAAGAYPEQAGPVYQVPPTQAHTQQPPPVASQPQVDVPVPGYEAPSAQAHTQQPAGYVYQVQPTHTYDQQPYPVVYGYPVGPAPVMYGHTPRPGVITAAAVLAYVQAGITGIATLIMFTGLFDSRFSSGRLLVQTVVVLAAAVGVGLLIAGGVRFMAGRDRTMLMVACVVEFVICLFYVIVFATISDSALDPDNTAELDGTLGAARGVLVVFAIFFAVMPTISLSLSRSRSATDFMRSRGVR